MFLVGLSGLKKSGKDTTADYIIRVLQPRHVEKIAFADALYEEVARATGTTVGYIRDHKSNFRLILQGWGTDYRRELISKEYWIKRLVDKVVKLLDTTYAVIVPDVRFANEAKTITDAGGWLFRVRRSNHPNEDTHISETELTDTNYAFNDYIDNNGTLEQLGVEVKRLVSRFGLLKS